MGSICRVLLLIIAVGLVLYTRYAPHLQKVSLIHKKHASFIIDPVFFPQDFKEMQNLAKKQKFLTTTNAESLIEYEYGSAEMDKNGKCQHSLQLVNNNRNKCVVPARVDVARHLLMTGSWGHKKESYEKLVSRSRFFQHFWGEFKNTSIPAPILRIFNSTEYKKMAKDVCEGREYFVPFQASALVNIPGQEVGMHLDTPWLFGADRTKFPIWLLVVMVNSGLYEDKYIRQIQGNKQENGGGFYFYDDALHKNMTLVEAIPNRGLIIDGTRVAHGTQTMQPGKDPIIMDKDSEYYSIFNEKTSRWEIRDMKDKLLKDFAEEDIRISVVWRQKCFKDEQEYLRAEREHQKQMKVEEVIDNLLQNLINKGIIVQKPTNEMETIQMILDNYIQYPFLPGSSFPYNYCMIPKFIPSLQDLFSKFC